MINKKVRQILHILSSIFMLFGVLLVVPLVMSIVLGEGRAVYQGYILPIFISLILGYIFHKMEDENQKIDISTGMMICSLGWFFVSLLGALPFYIILDKSFLDAFFEAVSGFTTTGITVITEISLMPLSVIFWRSFIQWLGGLGILTFFLFITFRSESEIWQLFSAETHKFDTSRPVPNFNRSIQILWSIYIFFTLLQTTLLSFLGVSFFDSLTHSFTTLSTGGFSRYDSSIAHFAEAGYASYIYIEYVVIFFMLMGGLNFLVHYKVFQGSIKEMFFDEETREYWKIFLGAVIIIFLAGIFMQEQINFPLIEERIRSTLFQVASIITTTGYQTEHIGSQYFPEISRIIFLLLMLIGGCVGSTSGGVKVIRVKILKKLFYKELKRPYLPHRAVFPLTINREQVASKEVLRTAGMFFGWLSLILLGGMITALFSHLDALQSLSGMFSAVSNIGPFYFSVSEMQELSPVIKITYIIGMLAGRLEIIPVLILFRKATWK